MLASSLLFLFFFLPQTAKLDMSLKSVQQEMKARDNQLTLLQSELLVLTQANCALKDEYDVKQTECEEITRKVSVLCVCV